MIETITAVNTAVNNFIWGVPAMVCIIGVGLLLSVRTGFLQIRKFPYTIKTTIGRMFRKKDASDGAITPFQAVCTALAGTVGTGNIAGVAGAIAIGGPGAVFWMWCSALLGMCTKFAEVTLAVHFRERSETGEWVGGPMYYIEKGLGMKWQAVLFSLVAGFACFGIGNISQSSEIAGAMEGLFGMSGLTTGVLLAVVVGIVVLGGVQRIGRVTSYMVPFMAIFYIGAGLAVILLRIDRVPAALASIFTSAFSFEAVGGGVFGYAIMVAMRQGFARGVFSNEAGLGSAPMAHAASETQEPVEQGMWGVFEVFIDTIVICTLTSLAVILSGVLDVGLDSYATNGAAAVAAFNAILPGTIGGTIIQISLLFFALSTILGWSYYGERCWAYLSNNNKAVVWIFKVVFVLVCIVGATGNGTLMWDISDTLNGMMAIPNLIGLLLLEKPAAPACPRAGGGFCCGAGTAGAPGAIPVFGRSAFFRRGVSHSPARGTGGKRKPADGRLRLWGGTDII